MASRRSSKRTSKSRKSTRGPKGARGPVGRPAGQTAIWLGAIALAGVAAIGTGIYLTEHKSSGGSPTPLPPGPSGQTTATLVQGHRYTVTFTCPSSQSTPTITGITGVSLVSTTPTTNGGIIVFDYTGASGSYPIAGAGCSVAILDNGVSPTPSLPSTGDVYSSLSAAQQTALQSALYAYISQSPNPCPTVMTPPVLASITGASALSDAGMRSSAVDCFQTGYNAKNGTQLGAANGPGVLDANTYAVISGNS